MSLSALEMHHGPWTEADYLALPEDNRRIELLDGAVLISPSGSSAHQRLSSRLWLAMERARPDGLEVFEAVNVRLGTGRILIPDLAVVRHTGTDFTVLDAREVAMAIEIISPGSVGDGPGNQAAVVRRSRHSALRPHRTRWADPWPSVGSSVTGMT